MPPTPRRCPPRPTPHDAPRPAPAADANRVLRLTTTQDVEDFLADVRQALRRSRRTGGCYTVVRLDDQRRPLLQIDVHVPVGELRPPARRRSARA